MSYPPINDRMFVMLLEPVNFVNDAGFGDIELSAGDIVVLSRHLYGCYTELVTVYPEGLSTTYARVSRKILL